MNQNFKFTKDEAQRISLHDNKSPFGGTAFRGETLDDFLTSIEINGNDGYELTLDKINIALNECGIMPIKPRFIQSTVGICFYIDGQYFVRKGNGENGFYYKSKYFHLNKPVYMGESQDEEYYYTGNDIIGLCEANLKHKSKKFARNFWRELDWQMPETLIDLYNLK